jgi:hypothetical protein
MTALCKLFYRLMRTIRPTTAEEIINDRAIKMVCLDLGETFESPIEAHQKTPENFQ